MNVVIIEDEPLLAEELSEQIIKAGSYCKVIAVLSSVKEALIFFRANNNYQIIFSDIQLGDGLSFDIFRQVNINAPIIFCTAYDRYAIEAFKNNAIDYLLKPFGKEAVSDALERYERLKNNLQSQGNNYQKIIKLIEATKPNAVNNTTILVSNRDKIIPVRNEDIALFFIHGGVVHLLDFNKNNYIVNQTLDELETLTGKKFYRADRQHLINRVAIKDVSQFFARKLKLNLFVDYTTIITVRKEKASEFLEWLSQH
jgi:two-component system, LytTR family, response regulator